MTILNRRPRFPSARGREILSALALPADLRRHRFDILHAQSPITAEALSLSGHRYVFTSHSRYWLTPATGLDRLWSARDRGAVRRASGVIALSPRVRPLFEAELARCGSGGLVDAIPFGVDVQRFQPPSEGSPRSGVVGLGVVVRHKRWDILAASARRARVPASVIGRVQDVEVAASARRLNPEVRFVGPVMREALATELGRAKVFVHPSDMELASVATVQAMACGLPVVGSDLLSDIVTDGQDGFLVDRALPFDRRVEATAGYIERLLSDPALWNRMAAHARATAVERHSWPRIAMRVAELYGKVAARSSVGTRRAGS
ncbi:MAG: glycosyltransferase family 4 protein [Thermoplasmata archaeon]|nr:glycosyltransferase family 4 protein [Thermoplasmata archaeon]MCI4359488.1 glycosyltransferase family 4 protein [Thermoplasmata archaeon]